MDESEFELLEIADQAQEVGKLTVNEYGRLRGITPQLIHYHIRNKHVEQEMCICGRKVIDVAKADEFFKKGDYA